MQTGLIRIVIGLVLTLGGVGGVEQSTNNVDMFLATVIAFVGLGFMAWATVAINRRTNSILADLRKY